ncbi:MAG: MraY family glycosyltransferase [Mariprofundaceae bacterium]|nr:MraY family glycosyltransferase [Mariprofundaceae bacterium]
MFITLDRPLSRYLALLLGILLVIPWQVQGLWLQGFFLFGSTFFLTFALMPLLIRVAHHMGALDYPDARRVHAQPTPRIGGVAVLLAVNISLLCNFNFSLAFKGVCLSALIVGLISLWDDMQEMPALLKLLGQLLAIAVLLYCDVVIQFAPETWWGDLLEYGVTAFWMLGITNAFNFLDGINGLAASLAMVTCLLMAALAWHTGQSYMLFLCLALAGGAAGFLPDNARYDQQARCFLGDVGSTYLGWMMAGIAVMGDWSSDGAIKAYSAPLLIFSVMIFDMIYTTIARFKRGDVHNFKEWIEFVGKDHLHHRLMDLGCNQAQAVLLIISFTLLMGLSALALIQGSLIAVVLLLIQAVVFYLALSFLMIRAQK